MGSRHFGLLVCGLALISFGLTGAVGAAVVSQVTDDPTATFPPTPVMDDLGSSVFINSSADLLGTNPEHRFQIFEFVAATGAAQQLTSFEYGVSDLPNAIGVSDDGQLLAFIAPSSPTGQNDDLSQELFVMQSDGSGLLQLTNDPGPGAGAVSQLFLSGSGNRIVFVSTSDPTGGNPDNREQVFVIDANGTGLLQLTSATDGELGAVSIDDAGSRVVLHSTSALTGLLAGIFAIDADGTNLRHLVPDPVDPFSLSFAGGGTRVAFTSPEDLTGNNPDFILGIFAVEWDGTNLRQVTDDGLDTNLLARQTSIIDNGAMIVYGNGTAIQRIVVANSAVTTVADVNERNTPVVSGSGARIAFSTSLSGERDLKSIPTPGGSTVDLLSSRRFEARWADTTADGNRIAFIADWEGHSPARPRQIYRIQSDGSDLFQITDIPDGIDDGPISIAGDGSFVVYAAWTAPWFFASEIFRAASDGSGAQQLTFASGGSGASMPVVSTNGARIAYMARDGGGFGSTLHCMNSDGSSAAQITSSSQYALTPRIDDAGEWVTYSSRPDPSFPCVDCETWAVFRERCDGSANMVVAYEWSHSSVDPDISGDGTRIVFSSVADFAGGNPDGNSEIFLYDSGTGTTTQITSTLEGGSYQPKISGDGARAYFLSDAPFFAQDPDQPFDLYTVSLPGGIVERAGGLRIGNPDTFPRAYDPSWVFNSYQYVTTDHDGDAVYWSAGDFSGDNPDLISEIWRIDRAAAANIVVSAATPTTLSWPVEPGPVRYDAIRGDGAELALGPGDLGTVVCLENDSPDNDTVGFEDPDDPLPGQFFFYLFRGSQGLLDGPGSYAQATGSAERLPSAGDCTP